MFDLRRFVHTFLNSFVLGILFYGVSSRSFFFVATSKFHVAPLGKAGVDLLKSDSFGRLEGFQKEGLLILKLFKGVIQNRGIPNVHREPPTKNEKL